MIALLKYGNGMPFNRMEGLQENLGIPLPAGSSTMASAAFASQGYFNFPLALTIGIVGNVLGDLFDFWLIRRFGKRFFRRQQKNKKFGSNNE